MEETNFLITTSIILAGIGISILVYKIYKPIMPTIDPLSATDLISQSAGDITPRAVQYIPKPFVLETSGDYLINHIFTDDSIAKNLLTKYTVYLEKAKHRIIERLWQSNMEMEEIHDELIRRLTLSRHWQAFVNYLKSIPPHEGLIEELQSGQQIVKLDYVYQYEPSAIVEFLNSELGIKCLIAGSIITITAIIIHLLITYYFKTTYVAIAIKCYNLIKFSIKISFIIIKDLVLNYFYLF